MATCKVMTVCVVWPRQWMRALHVRATYAPGLGGEEFVLLLPATDEGAARNVAERCRKLLARKEIEHARSGVGRLVTVSMGVGTILPSALIDPHVFLDRIDRRLYQAKSGGRDRICDVES